jgi:hypothetical protein
MSASPIFHCETSPGEGAPWYMQLRRGDFGRDARWLTTVTEWNTGVKFGRKLWRVWYVNWAGSLEQRFSPSATPTVLRGHRNFNVGIRYFKFKTDPRFPPPCTPAKLKYCSSHILNLVESGFSWLTYLLSIVRHHPDVMNRDDLPLSLTTLQPDIQTLAKCPSGPLQ